MNWRRRYIVCNWNEGWNVTHRPGCQRQDFSLQQVKLHTCGRAIQLWCWMMMFTNTQKAWYHSNFAYTQNYLQKCSSPWNKQQHSISNSWFTLFNIFPNPKSIVWQAKFKNTIIICKLFMLKMVICKRKKLN